jgi:hypothetical protein
MPQELSLVAAMKQGLLNAAVQTVTVRLAEKTNANKNSETESNTNPLQLLSQ